MAKKIKVRTDKDDEVVDAEQTADQATQSASALAEAEAAAGVQDEFQAKGFEFVEWIHDHQPVVLGAIGAIVLGGVVLGITSVVGGSRNESASAAYGKAVEAYDSPL